MELLAIIFVVIWMWSVDRRLYNANKMHKQRLNEAKWQNEELIRELSHINKTLFDIERKK